MFVLLFVVAISQVYGQKDSVWISGEVHDGFTGERIDSAKVFLLNKDSVVLDSTSTDRWSNFYFKVKRDKSFRSCIIKVERPKYQMCYRSFSLRYAGRSIELRVPTIFIKRKNTLMDQTLPELAVTATRVKMFYRGDTLVYNADAFNVANGSMLDALIRQLPGTELTRNGEIFVNGKKVDNLMLNGKDFFRGNNKLMLENLPYYTVKEIKVYDKTSERAIALQDTLAPKDFVMDVNLKREYSKGYMANVEVGAGTEDAYLARLFGLRFTDVSRLAVVGGLNNLNMSDYTMNGYSSDKTAREGRRTSRLLTAELMTEHKRNKNVLTVELTNKKSEYGSDEYQETYQNVGSTYSTTQNKNNARNLGLSLSNKHTLKLPIWLENTTNVRYNSQKSENDAHYFESGYDTRQQGLQVLDSLFNLGEAIKTPSMISARKQLINSRRKEYGASHDVAFSKRVYFGDIIDFSAGIDYTKSTNDRDRHYNYLTWGNKQAQENVTENIDQPYSHLGVKTEASYKLALQLQKIELKFFAGYRFNRDKDRETILDVNSSIIDAENSYNRRMTENVYKTGIGFHHWNNKLIKDGDLQITVNLPVSFVDRNTSYTRSSLDTCMTQSPVFFEPSFTIGGYQYTNQGQRETLFELSSSLKYSLPEATQLITLPVTSDRINIYQGNASLKSPAVWTSSLTGWIKFKPRNSYLVPTLTFTNFINRIIYTYSYENGVYTNRPDNIAGTWNLEFSLRGRHGNNKWFLNYTPSVVYNHMKNYVADGTSGMYKQIKNGELHLSLPCRFGMDITKNGKVSMAVSASADWRKPLNGRAELGYSDTWEYRVRPELYANLPLNIDFNTECNVVKRTGYSNDELNKLTYIWNLNLSMPLFKNKVLLKIMAIDILRQYKSVAYVVNERGICETRAFTLPSYLLFRATYKFNRQPKKK